MEGHSKDQLRRFAVREKRNEESVLGFILSLIFILVALTLIHHARQYVQSPRRRKGSNHVSSSLIVASRKLRIIRKLSLRPVLGVPCLGHAGIITLYVALNLIGLLANLDNQNMAMITNVASRAAWLAISNLMFVILLALKNTPLAFMTARSYERLNCLHRVAGYAAVSLIIIHASSYSYYFCSTGNCSRLLRKSDICGMVAGLSWFLLALAAVVVRRWHYELFYPLHITLWMLSIVMIGLHQPHLTAKTTVGLMIAGAMWALDRILRFVRIVLYSINNKATLTPLPNGGTRVTLAKPPRGAALGKHCFLWIPRVRFFQTHPFTIASTNPFQFVVASRSGFTDDLHNFALANPGTTIKASVEGPYGAVPDASTFDTVVLVAGGSGASFAFAMAQALLDREGDCITKRVVLVWVVRFDSYLTWFAEQLITLKGSALFDLQMFVTRSKMKLPASDSSDCSTHKEKKKIKYHKAFHRAASDAWTSKESVTLDDPHRLANIHGIPIVYHRPDVASLIRQVVNQTSAEERILISGCGPPKLMDAVQATTAGCISSHGPSIELYCEQFGW